MGGEGEHEGSARTPAGPEGHTAPAAARRPISRRIFLRVGAATGSPRLVYE